MSFGSGTLVHVDARHGVILTNWHVVRDASGPVHVMFPDGFQSAGSVVKIDRDWDLAVVAVWKPNAEPVALANSPPRVGDLLTIAGYGPVGEYRAAGGRCVGFVAPMGNHPQEMCEVAVRPRQGDSGGPIFDTQGRLAGVLFGGSGGRTMGSHSGRVRWFLANVLPAFNHREPQQLAERAPPPPQKTVETPKRQIESPALVKLERPVPAVAARGPQQAAPESARPEPVRREVAKSEPVRQRAARPEPIRRRAARPEPVRPDPAVAAAPRAERNPPAGKVDLSPPPSANRRPAQAALDHGGKTVTWQDIAGVTAGQQIKTVLAAIGVFAVLLHAIRLLATE